MSAQGGYIISMKYKKAKEYFEEAEKSWITVHGTVYAYDCMRLAYKAEKSESRKIINKIRQIIFDIKNAKTTIPIILGELQVIKDDYYKNKPKSKKYFIK